MRKFKLTKETKKMGRKGKKKERMKWGANEKETKKKGKRGKEANCYAIDKRTWNEDII